MEGYQLMNEEALPTPQLILPTPPMNLSFPGTGETLLIPSPHSSPALFHHVHLPAIVVLENMIKHMKSIHLHYPWVFAIHLLGRKMVAPKDSRAVTNGKACCVLASSRL